MKDFKALACCFEVQDTNAHPWSVEMLRKKEDQCLFAVYLEEYFTLYTSLFPSQINALASSEKLLGEGTALLTGPNGVRICAVQPSVGLQSSRAPIG
tara:strand:+ start:158 stop:448 length:291 start_codon:yes stop_codon:yes gene_type:complete